MQNVTNDKWYCGNCKFFAPGEDYHEHNELPEFDCYTGGQCRAWLPIPGEVVKDHNDDDFRHYSDWPSVLATDWCGRFEHK